MKIKEFHILGCCVWRGMEGAPRGWKLNYPRDTSPVVITEGRYSNKSLIVFPPEYVSCVRGAIEHRGLLYCGLLQRNLESINCSAGTTKEIMQQKLTLFLNRKRK
jgi:hypothetical protein